MEESVKTPEQLVLENRKVKVVPIIRDKAFFKKGHDGEFLFSGCFRNYGLPVNTKTRSYFNPFAPGEREAFEKLLNLKAGDLSVSNRNSEFWSKYGIKLDKEEKELNLTEIDHALMYRIMKVNPKFAKENDDPTRLEFQYQLVDERYVQEKYSEQSLKKADAYTELNKLARSKKKMVDTLRLLGVKMDESSSENALKSKLAQVIEEPESSKNRGIKTIIDFMSIVTDPQSSAKLFVLDAIDAREVIVENGDEYRLGETQKLIGRSLKGAVDWFSDIANQETKLLIQERMKVK